MYKIDGDTKREAGRLERLVRKLYRKKAITRANALTLIEVIENWAGFPNNRSANEVFLEEVPK